MIPDVSLDRVLGRTREVEGCLEWAGYAAKEKFPQIRVDHVCYPVRRLVYQLVHGELTNPEVWVGCKCKNPLCVNPDHLVARTRAKAIKGYKMPVKIKQKISDAKREKSRINMEIAREIRMSNETNGVLGDRYGLKPGYVSKIRNFERWVEHVTPWCGLGSL